MKVLQSISERLPEMANGVTHGEQAYCQLQSGLATPQTMLCLYVVVRFLESPFAMTTCHSPFCTTILELTVHWQTQAFCAVQP